MVTMKVELDEEKITADLKKIFDAIDGATVVDVEHLGPDGYNLHLSNGQRIYFDDEKILLVDDAVRLRAELPRTLERRLIQIYRAISEEKEYIYNKFAANAHIRYEFGKA